MILSFPVNMCARARHILLLRVQIAIPASWIFFLAMMMNIGMLGYKTCCGQCMGTPPYHNFCVIESRYILLAVVLAVGSSQPNGMLLQQQLAVDRVDEFTT